MCRAMKGASVAVNFFAAKNIYNRTLESRFVFRAAKDPIPLNRFASFIR
jgi:hypothetical protein